MIIQCSWCKRKMGEKPPIEDKRITHGICSECVNKLEEENYDRSNTKNKW